jgi:mRNA interferase MazF
MVIRRGEVYWAEVGRAGEQTRRPVVVVQAQPYNDSRLPTVLTAVITSDTRLAAMPGSVFLPAAVSRLPADAVVDVTALVPVRRGALTGPVGSVPPDEMRAVDDGLRTVLGLR